MKKILSTLLTLMIIIPALAQERITVKGTVLDETGTPLIGAGVTEKGTSNGVVTDLDGMYEIKVAKDAELTFSYISYADQDVKVEGKTSIDVSLQPDKNVLDEVVVIGYGTMKKSDLTGSVGSVNSKTLENFKTGSVVEALAGQVAGVSITAADGTPGSGFDIKIRGVGTVNGDASPLYIVDGFEVDDISVIANQDVLSVDFLKDASASAIYGARAANGVVLVTTKSGREGRPQVTYNGSASYRQLSRRLELLTPYDFVALQMEVNPSKYGSTYYKAGNDADGVPYKYQSLEDYRNLDQSEWIDWQNEAFRPTWSQNHDVSIRGGIKDSQYTVSFSHFDENGIFTNSGFARNTARVKIQQKVTKWLTFQGSLNYTSQKRTGIGTGGGQLANLLSYRPVGGLNVSAWELRNLMYDPTAQAESNFDSNKINPIVQAESTDDIRKSEQWIGNVSLSAQLAKGLTFKTAATYNSNFQRRDIFYHETTSQAYRAGGPYGETTTSKNTRWQNSNTLNYKRTFKKKHSVDAMIGQEVAYIGSESLKGQSRDFPFDDLGNNNLGLGATPSLVETTKAESLRLSFFARGFYSYDDRYMVTATVRADASTVFSKKNKWGVFPSFAASWNMANESWLKDVQWLNTLKLRAGWGTVGNDRITNYLSMNLYTDSKLGVGTSQTTILTPKQLANYNLRWEGSMTTNVGLDLGFFDSRLTATIDGFVKDTKDLLLKQNLAYVTGFEEQMQNVGKIRNAGVELTLHSVNFNKRNFFWTTDFNLSYIKNTLVALQDGTAYITRRSEFNSNFTSDDYIAYVGGSLGDMYGYIYDGVYQSSDFNMTPGGNLVLKPGVADLSPRGTVPAPGVVKYRDVNGDGKITPDDRTSIGNGYPDLYGGLTNSFQFYGVDLSFMFQFSVGNDVYNATRMYLTQTKNERVNQMHEVADRWTPSNASTKVPSANGYISYDVSSRFIEDGSFLRLKNITLGYTLPENITRRFYVSKLRVYATAQNLFCLTNYSGYDPEVSVLSSPLTPGFDWGAYPKSRVFTFGVELQF
ncbi:MAG: TonB-dependent receptor [Bacteroidales bacterium]|nr:TonB-dependent receptor [Bacteroidales bacterium]